ncbi:MAG: type II toxin-antitoxin system HicA family toxin [Candidatus Burarchaeum sp.]|nr:type II toxin-antitoxin system HicA family toxin [Candidatus Burarchaeum sp.]MDO8339487.1 type II toxin-antitoxin system HicA family toxin [Candidatus Burarchaeum sp.]
MAGLRNITSKQMVEFLKSKGFSELRQKGSHLSMFSPSTKHLTVVPMHGTKEIPIGTILSILRSAGLSRKELEEFLGR